MYYNNPHMSTLPNVQSSIKSVNNIGMPSNSSNNFMMPPFQTQQTSFPNDSTGQDFDPAKHMQMPMVEVMYSNVPISDVNDPMNWQQQMMPGAYMNSRMMGPPFDPTNYMAYSSQNPNPQLSAFEVRPTDQALTYNGDLQMPKTSNFNADRRFDNANTKKYDAKRNHSRNFERSRSPVKEGRNFRDRERNDDREGYRNESRSNFNNRRTDRRNDNRDKNYDNDNHDRRDFNRNRSAERKDNFRNRDEDNGIKGRNRDDQRFNNGDWDCPKCNNSNWARRDKCHRCQADRLPNTYNNSNKSNDGKFNRNSRDGSRRNQSRHQEYREGDWRCIKCNGNNFSKRQSCYRCHEDRPENTKNPFKNDEDQITGTKMDNPSYFNDNSKLLKVSDSSNLSNRVNNYEGLNSQSL